MPTQRSYNDIIAEFDSRTLHILLGNGFSIGCDKIFQYPKLYDYAVKRGLSVEAQQIFQHLGTSNFEGVLRLLDDANFVAQTYQLTGVAKNPIKTDAGEIKRILVESIAQNHLPLPSDVPDSTKDCCALFLRPFTHIFTTNYDLLLYWMLMHDLSKTVFDDGFRDSEEDHDVLSFSSKLADKRGVLFLHGALHLYVQSGEVRKQSWNKSGHPILQLVTEGISREQYPLFIAEGDGEKKKDQIVRNAYLSYAWSKFKKIASPLIIYGHSLSQADSHLSEAIASNLDLSRVFIGVYGDLTTAEARRLLTVADGIRERREELTPKTSRKKIIPLTIEFFDSRSVPVWSTPD
jgi:hypothetical protein